MARASYCFIREQNAEREIIEFAGNFGELDDHASTPYYRLENFPQLMEITTRLINGRPSETRNVDGTALRLFVYTVWLRHQCYFVLSLRRRRGYNVL